MRIGLNVRHDVDKLARRVSAMPRDLKDAMRDATPEATDALAAVVEDAIEVIAGGVYWPIDTQASVSGDGGRGRVVVSKSKPHRIEPTKEHGLLVFEAGGETVFVRGGVDHPGSNPPRGLVSALERSPLNAVEEPYEDRVGRALRGGL